MTSDKAWYWVAAGVLALGLSNSLADREIGLPRGLADQFQGAQDQFLASASDTAIGFLDSVGRLSDSNDFGNPTVQVSLARVQSRVACLSSMVAERQAELARQEAERAQEVSIEESISGDSCPRQKTQETVTKVRFIPDDDTI